MLQSCILVRTKSVRGLATVFCVLSKWLFSKLLRQLRQYRLCRQTPIPTYKTVKQNRWTARLWHFWPPTKVWVINLRWFSCGVRIGVERMSKRPQWRFPIVIQQCFQIKWVATYECGGWWVFMALLIECFMSTKDWNQLLSSCDFRRVFSTSLCVLVILGLCSSPRRLPVVCFLDAFTAINAADNFRLIETWCIQAFDLVTNRWNWEWASGIFAKFSFVVTIYAWHIPH